MTDKIKKPKFYEPRDCSSIFSIIVNPTIIDPINTLIIGTKHCHPLLEKFTKPSTQKIEINRNFKL